MTVNTLKMILTNDSSKESVKMMYNRYGLIKWLNSTLIAITQGLVLGPGSAQVMCFYRKYEFHIKLSYVDAP